MLITNMSLTLSTHYCKGKAVKSSISLSRDDLGCGMVNMDEQNDTAGACKQKLQRRNCCENTYATLFVEDDYSNSKNFSPTADLSFIIAFSVAYINNFFLFDEENIDSFIAHSPPLIEQDKSILFQVFRI